MSRWLTGTKRNKRGCLYENDEIVVEHFVADFQDGTREAVLTVHLLKDGLLWRTETGSTPIKIDELAKKHVMVCFDNFCWCQARAGLSLKIICTSRVRLRASLNETEDTNKLIEYLTST